MASEITMPQMGFDMTEGVIAAWHKKVGDAVKKGDLLAEVETDKATMDLESYKDGTLLYLGTEKGGKVQAKMFPRWLKILLPETKKKKLLLLQPPLHSRHQLQQLQAPGLIILKWKKLS